MVPVEGEYKKILGLQLVSFHTGMHLSKRVSQQKKKEEEWNSKQASSVIKNTVSHWIL